MRKMSEVLLELAMSVFRDPAATPAYEAACAALLLAHVAWNQELPARVSDAKVQGHPEGVREGQAEAMGRAAVAQTGEVDTDVAAL